MELDYKDIGERSRRARRRADIVEDVADCNEHEIRVIRDTVLALKDALRLRKRS